MPNASKPIGSKTVNPRSRWDPAKISFPVKAKRFPPGSPSREGVEGRAARGEVGGVGAPPAPALPPLALDLGGIVAGRLAFRGGRAGDGVSNLLVAGMGEGITSKLDGPYGPN